MQAQAAPLAASPRLQIELVTDFVARAVVVALFTVLSVNILGEFLRTGHLTGLLLLASESLVVVLTLVRRRTHLVDRSLLAGVTTVLSVLGPPLLRAGNVPTSVPDGMTSIVSALGLLLVVVGKMTLGRSFGIAPANRGVVARGPYSFVRHPIYAGYLITHIAFIVAHPTTWNITTVLVADSALIIRALLEERVLRADAQYQTYCERVSWHLVPGVF